MNSRALLPLALFALAAVALVLLGRGAGHGPGSALQPAPAGAAPSGATRGAIARAAAAHAHGLGVAGAGVVVRVLPDDEHGSRHQRLLVRTDDGPTVLIAHNIDLAPRVAVAAGDRVSFRGEYEWNDQGGVVHWTHRDPRGVHEAGFIEHDGRVVD